MGNSFGTVFKISTWGESHGGGIGVVLDGCPPGLSISEEELQVELDRRKPGQSKITTQRKESDLVKIVSGVYEGRTLGTPIAMLIPNSDHRPEAYTEMKEKYRPSHADYTYQTKFGRRNHEGGGRSSARETAGRVAAGAIAKKILEQGAGVVIRAYVSQIQDLKMENPMGALPSLEQIEANPVRCPDPEMAKQMEERILQVRKDGDSVGGIVQCRVVGLPVGLGIPVFDRLEADLAKGMLSIPATKAFEFGSGFDGVLLRGSEHNDLFVNQEGQIRTSTNRSGGIQGGISNGEELYFRTAFKPTATIIQKQQTVTLDGDPTELIGRGRHDPCVVPRAVPIIEAMTALVLVDHFLRDSAQCKTFDFNSAS